MNTQMLCEMLDDVDEHCAHARLSGARVVDEPSTTGYGEDYWSDRSYRAEDPEGHQWFFVQRIKTGKD